MFFGLNLFPLADVVCLPQNEDDPKQRSAELEENSTRYKWSRDVIPGCPMIDGVPPRPDYPAIGWVEGILRTIFRIISNNLALRYSSSRQELDEEKRHLITKIGAVIFHIIQKITTGSMKSEEVAQVAEEVGSLFGPDIEGIGTALQDYDDMFKVFKPDVVANLRQFLRDDVFGWYRVAGPSPLHMRKLTTSVSQMFPELDDTILKGISAFEDDNIADMEKEGRLFYLDYKEFDGVTAGKLPDGTSKEGMYVYAPTALLAIPKVRTDRNPILPIAIKCGQGSKYPMYTASSSHTDPITWLSAKITVQVADAVMHETRYHLGRTHLLLECFICAMRRTLAPNHPLHKFLDCHFEGTAIINFLGSLRLAAPGGTIDVITAPPIQTTVALCAEAMRPPFKFNDWMPDREMELRGVLGANLHYPYRDDGLKLWEAIQAWVGEYISAYYRSDADVAADKELANWCREIVHPDCGAVSGFGETDDGQVKTVKYLVRFVSLLVYIGSVQHSALNFPQGTLMQYVPAMPLSGFDEAPTTARPYECFEDMVSRLLPSLKIARRQLNTAELLAGFQWTTLGEYGRDLNFAPDQVDDALKKFKENLSKIGAEIQTRNEQERLAGLPVYDFLVPRNIPQSANV